MSSSFPNLDADYANLQQSLNVIEESIRKVTGDGPRLYKENGRTRVANDLDRSRFGLKRKTYGDNEDLRSAKRSSNSGISTREGREQVLEEQKNNKSILQRNKRMFGSLLSTLEKFKQEEMKRVDTKKRAEIEMKLDKAAEEEREALKKERSNLFQQRKQKMIQLKYFEKKMQIIESHKEWQDSQKSLINFIETKAKPHIFYLPAQHNSVTSKSLQETKDKYRIVLAEKRAKVQKEIGELDEQYEKNLSEINIQGGSIETPKVDKVEDNKIGEEREQSTQQDDDKQVAAQQEEHDAQIDNLETNDEDLAMNEDREFEPIYD